MGRKNKIKMHKNGSASPSPAKPPVPERMKESLRELIGNAPAEANQKLQYLFSELEKKSLELGVAKECIKQLQQEKPFDSFRGDGDSAHAADLSLQESIHQNQENILNLAEVHVAFNDEWKSIEEKVENLTGERVTLEGELNAAHEEIHVLKDEVKYLESSIEKTNKSLEQGQQSSVKLEERLKGIINNLESDLSEANIKIGSLQAEIKDRDLTHSTVLSDLQSEKEKRAKQEETLSEYSKAMSEANSKLKDVLKETSLIQNQIIHLAFAIGEMGEDEELAQKRENGQGSQPHFENVTDSILHIKHQFISVKNELSKVRNQNECLHQRVANSEAEIEIHRKKCDEYCLIIKDLQEQNVEVKRSNEALISATQRDFDRMKQKFEDEINSHQLTISRLEENSALMRKELDSVKMEFQQELTSGSVQNVLEAIQELKDNYQTIKMKNESEEVSFAATGNQLIDAQNELSGKSIEMTTIEQDYMEKIAAEKVIFENKRLKLEEELSSSRSMLKKIRKERDSSTKKWKRRVDEVIAEKSLVVEQKKELEEKLSELSDASIRDESFRSITEQSDAYRSQCESMKSELDQLKEVQMKNEQDLSKLSETLVNKDKEIVDLNQTILAQKSSIDQHAESITDKLKLIERMESRMIELQRSAETMQKRHDEDHAATRQQLESSESLLEAQRMLNAKLATENVEMQKKHVVEVANLTKKIDQLNKNIEELSETMNEMRNNRVNLVESMESKIQLLELENQTIQNELATCKINLADAIDRANGFEKELTRIVALERKKTEVLVALTEEEKARICEEKEKVMLQLETAQKNLKQQKSDDKKLFDSDIRKLKKVIKTVEEQKSQALAEVSQIAEKLEETKKLQLEATMFLEEEEKKHKRMMVEFEELQKSVEKYRAEHEKQLETEVSLKESLQSQVVQQDIDIERLSESVKLGEIALKDMTQKLERKEHEFEVAIEVERNLAQHVQKKLAEALEQMEQLVERQNLLEQTQQGIDELRNEYETSLRNITSCLEKKEAELKMKEVELEQNSDLCAELERLKKIVVDKDAIIDGMNKQKSELESEKSELETEIQCMSKQLADSPKKVIQLENRLGVMQSAASAQYKRLEEDLLKSNNALEIATKNNAEFNEMLTEKLEIIHQLSEDNSMMRSKLAKFEETGTSVHQLQKEVEHLRQVNQDLDEENKHERAGLVNELIATKEKMGEYETIAAKQRSEIEHLLFVEKELMEAAEKNIPCSTESTPSPDTIDEMFPTMDPAVRQLLRLLVNNRNFAYGMSGFVVYMVLIHLCAFL